ncbi:hypothetical protein BDZ45DRAFT_774505 [Acephala macrosclerotiorum]|nr:hypothetical protein BDZ45DRAFT_774505 [Acephala macrosclerotiorum]
MRKKLVLAKRAREAKKETRKDIKGCRAAVFRAKQGSKTDPTQEALRQELIQCEELYDALETKIKDATDSRELARVNFQNVTMKWEKLEAAVALESAIISGKISPGDIDAEEGDDEDDEDVY